jgi:hypothetical protein
MLPTAEEKRAALDEVLQTATFVRAGQLQGFLRLICEMEIGGRAGAINEYLIGVEVLGRPEGYSPSQDSVVRRRAVDLREKLDEVYAGELATAAVRIELPKGRYVPRFVRVAAAGAAVTAMPTAEGPPVPPTAPRASRWPLAAAFVAGAAMASAVFLGVEWRRARRAAAAEAGASYEAEAKLNTLGGTAVVEMCEGCSGQHRVRRIGHLPASSIVVRGIQVPSTGVYAVVIHYLLKGDRTFFVRVNDGPGLEVPLSGTSWTEPAQVPLSLPLRAGGNTIELYNDSEYAPDLDKVVVRLDRPI